MSKTLKLLLSGAVLWSQAVLASTETKIVFVDVRKAVESTKAGQKVKTELEAEFKKREKELQKRADDIKKMTQDFEKKSAVLSDEARIKKQQELQDEMIKYNQEVTKNTQDIRKKEQDLMEPIFKKMQDVINKIAKDENISMVLQSRDNVIYAVKEMDLTEKVIKEFEKK
jgi:outer membrane protein